MDRLSHERTVLADIAIGRFTYITKNYGIDALLNIVATQFGIKVDQYAIFCMNNIQDIIDALGGVTLTVTDAEAHSPLEGIRVISRSAEAPELTDTVYTDRAGAYLMEFEHIFPNVEKVELRADAQERENGILFEEARHTIIITEEDYTGRGEGSSWNHGTVTKSVDFALERKK